MVYQLVDQNLLERTPGDRPTLRLTETAWTVMRGQRSVRLLRPSSGTVAKGRFEEDGWKGVDQGLFDDLRQLRRQLANDRGVPPYLIFGDATLRELARTRPSSVAAFASVRGVGEHKLKDLGPDFLARIRSYCEEHDLLLGA